MIKLLKIMMRLLMIIFVTFFVLVTGKCFFSSKFLSQKIKEGSPVGSFFGRIQKKITQILKSLVFKWIMVILVSVLMIMNIFIMLFLFQENNWFFSKKEKSPEKAG